MLGQDLIAQYRVYELARQHDSTVVLDGQGADELLAGMSLYESQMFPALLFRGHWLQFVIEIRTRMRRYNYSLSEALKIFLRPPLARKWMENRGLPKYSCEEFEALLITVMREHANAAVDVGTLLSGGLDTSMLARLLADHAIREGKARPKTFSIIFDDPMMTEWPYQQLVLAQGGLRGVNHVLTADQAWNTIEQVVWAEGQPLLGQD